MENKKRNPVKGISCLLPDQSVNGLLLHISDLEYDFFSPWCLKIASREMMLPESVKGLAITPSYLRELGHQAIWELVLHVYPMCAPKTEIETYEDFLNSSCLCCMIYYDSGWLDIYIKDDVLFADIQTWLQKLEAKEIVLLTDANDKRTIMHC